MNRSHRTYHSINRWLLAISATVFIGLLLLLKARCFGGCNPTLELLLLKPIMYYTGILSAILVVLFTLRRLAFKSWLLYIASWYIPLSIYVISRVEAPSVHMLSYDRGMSAIWWMTGLFIITVLYLVIFGMYDWYAKRRKKQIDL